MSLRTLHPEPSRLIPLGEAARVAGVPHLRVRQAVASGDLATLPALHLGQRIRLVEPAALEACFPTADLTARRPFEPGQRGIEWIGVSTNEQPPQECLPAALHDPVSDAAPAECDLRREAPPSGKTGTVLEAGSPPRPDTPEAAEGPAAPARTRLSLANLVDASFGGAPDSLVASQVVPNPSQAEAPRERASAAIGGDLMEAEIDGEVVGLDSGAVPGSPSAPSDGGLARAVARWEGRNRGKRVLVRGLLTAWGVVLAVAWLQFEQQGETVAFASWFAPGAGEVAEGVTGQGQSAEALASIARSKGEQPGHWPASPAAETPEGIDPADEGGPRAAEASGARDEQDPPTEGLTPDEGVVALPAGTPAPRFTGSACAWWGMTQPGADLRPVLGPCKGPWDEHQRAVVGLHRDGTQPLCSHHLRFVRDLGGDLEAELASAAAAREGGLPPPLLAMRIDGAARTLIRERVGRWVESGFETGRDHVMSALGDGHWRVRTWVVAAKESGDLARLNVDLQLSLADGPHQDTLQSFVLTEDEGAGHQGR